MKAVHPIADPSRPMPCGAAARVDEIHAALSVLRGEERRLQRLGFETPLAHCHAQRRYWEFLGALLQLPADPVRNAGA